MRQVLSWTFGSFFRTIGKVIAFLLLGAVAAYFFATHDIKLPNIFRFALTQVNASTFQPLGTNFYYNGSNTAIPYVNNYDMFYIQQEPATESIHYFSMMPGALVNPSSGVRVPTGATYVNFKGLIRQRSSSLPDIECVSYQGTGEHEYCDQWDFNNNYTFSLDLGQYDSGGGYPITSCQLSIPNFGTFNSNNGIAFTARCPIFNNTISLQYVRFSFNNYPVNFDLGLGLYMQFVEVNDTQAIIDAQNENTQAIEDQTQQQQEQHEEIMDTNMTETNETATSFFNSFETEDIGGLSGIVTAPLVMINSMLSGSCVQPSATWKGATISLPCGDMLWSRNGASDLKNLLNVFYGGILCYYAIRKLFLMVEGMKDPTNDRIEVSDL